MSWQEVTDEDDISVWFISGWFQGPGWFGDLWQQITPSAGSWNLVTVATGSWTEV